MHAAEKSASKEADGDAMESDSGSNSNQRKHSALTRQGKVLHKDRCKGTDSKSSSATPLLSDCGGSFISCKAIAAVCTVKINIAQLTAHTPHLLEAMMDLDTHANNTVLGGSCLLIHDTGRKVDVLGFSTALGLMELPIVSGAVVYDHPTTGKVYILVFHQMIFCRQMDNHLICPMQCRVNDVAINNTPKMCILNPDDSTHSIEVADPLDPDTTLHIPLILRGVTSCFCIRKPSTAEFEDDDIPKLNMTYEFPKWDPGDPDWATQEASMMDLRGQVHDCHTAVLDKDSKFFGVCCNALDLLQINCHVLSGGNHNLMLVEHVN
jgi:hypothetical protein